MQVLDRECAGEKTDLGVATFSYRKTSRVEVADSAKAVRFIKRRRKDAKMISKLPHPAEYRR